MRTLNFWPNWTSLPAGIFMRTVALGTSDCDNCMPKCQARHFGILPGALIKTDSMVEVTQQALSYRLVALSLEEACSVCDHLCSSELNKMGLDRVLLMLQPVRVGERDYMVEIDTDHTGMSWLLARRHERRSRLLEKTRPACRQGFVFVSTVKPEVLAENAEVAEALCV
jgi:hypothetical protein